MNDTEEIVYHKDQMSFDFNSTEDTTEEKFWYDSYTGTYWLSDEEWEEPREFTEDELIEEGINFSFLKDCNYLNEFIQGV